MQCLALLDFRPGADRAAVAQRRDLEARAVWALHMSGFIRTVHFRSDRFGVVMLIEAADAGQAEEVLSGLPMVRDGLLTLEIVPLAPFTGFEALFAARSDTPT